MELVNQQSVFGPFTPSHTQANKCSVQKYVIWNTPTEV